MNVEDRGDGYDSPYPGLRPFRDDESAVFFGRESQIDEVLARLGRQRFVVVLGGSGSGKSSLIKAGVIPGLRSYRLREAGDVWLTVVATPGTNQATADVPEAQRTTPIDRLAAKLVNALAPTEAARRAVPDAARVREVAATLRERDGWHKVYSQVVPLNEFDGVSTPAALDALHERTNLLVVLDQFEELFHPSNAGVADCQRLVERVLEHDSDPHPRMFLVLTMRSEYLNRCAAYLRLPDAINKASYLVRRLSPFEIKQCITLPAQHHLSMLANRAQQDDVRLPRHIVFDPEVLQRVLDDVAAMTHNPDHLPLLQHLLARLWGVALARARAAGQLLPEHITRADLAQAVSADAAASRELPDKANVLSLSVQSWADRTWRALSDAQRQQMDGLLPRLAFKDPNTGEEVQRRLRADEGVATLGAGADAARLKQLVTPFLAPLDYLHWDDENPQAITVKVSHEAFIRGWPHFRDSVAKQADGFDDFLEALRRCEDWLEQGRSDELLLGRDQLSSMRAHGFDPLLPAADQPIGRDWLRLLDIKHDGQRWAARTAELPELAERSQHTIASRKRIRLVWAFGIPAALSVTLGLGALWLVESVAGTRMHKLYGAWAAADAQAVTQGKLDVVRAQDSTCALEHVRQIAEGRLAVGADKSMRGSTADFLYGLPFFSSTREHQQVAGLLSEKGVGRTLEIALDQLPLLVAKSSGSAPKQLRWTDAGSCGPGASQRCWCLHADDGRAIQIAELPIRGDDWSLELRSASGRNCDNPSAFYRLPPATPVYIDASLRRMIFSAPSAALNRLDWGLPAGESGSRSVRVSFNSGLGAAQDELRGLAGDGIRVVELPSRRGDEHLEIDLDKTTLLQMNLEARQAAATAGSQWQQLPTLADACRAGHESLHSLVGALHDGKTHYTVCDRTSTAEARNRASSSVAAAADSAALTPAAEYASLLATFRLPAGVQPTRWEIGVAGPRTGWVAGITDNQQRFEAPITLSARAAALTRLLQAAPTALRDCGKLALD